MRFEVRPSVPRRVLFGVFLLLAALASQAQEEAPRFLLEKITVEGPREAAGRIVKAETLLREGESYSEAELAQAVARIHRIPFVLDADFSLRKGSTRGAYELLIQVVEARRFLFENTDDLYTLAEPLNLDNSVGDANEWSVVLRGLIGYRQFIGRSGVVFAALDSKEGVQVGFTRYDLLGRGIVVSAGVSGLLPDFCCTSEVLPYGLDPTFVFWGWGNSAHRLSLEAGVPLNGTDAVRFDWSRRDGEGSSRHEVLARFREQGSFLDFTDTDITLDRAELKWVRDTSDDPVVPTRGFMLSGGLEWGSFETGPLRRILVGEDGGFVEQPMPAQRSEQLAVAASAGRHWSVSPRQTISGLAHLSLGRASLHDLPTSTGASVSEDLDVFSGSLGLQHLARLKQSRGQGNFGDIYLESQVEFGVEATSPDLQPSRAPNPLERLELSVGLVFRSVWGRLRLMVSYLDVGEVLR